MRREAGFDLVPRLSNKAVDTQAWESFIDAVLTHYETDSRVRITGRYIKIFAGSCAVLPFDGQKFLRFHTTVWGITKYGGNGGMPVVTTKAQSYIDTVTTLARRVFGIRVKAGDDMSRTDGFYHFGAAYRSIQAYTKPYVPHRSMPDASTTSSDSSSLVWSSWPPGDEYTFGMLDIAGKGKGLVACLDIPKGARIFSEKPFLTAPCNMDPSLLEEVLIRRFNDLPEDSKLQFLSLHENPHFQNLFLGKYAANNLPCDEGIGGIYAILSRINHSCLPNAHYSWNPEKGHKALHAVRPIRAGEEITAMYSAGLASAKSRLGMTAASSVLRKSHLKETLGFECDCAICSLPPSRLQLSDDRRVQMRCQLSTKITDYTLTSEDAEICLAACYNLFKLLEEEFGGHDLADYHVFPVYHDAFWVCIAHADEARASAFAERCYQAQLICKGEDNPETQRMKHFAECPASSSMYRYCGTAWESDMDDVPHNLDDEGFKKWLWRQGEYAIGSIVAA